MDIFSDIDILDCPLCQGPGLIQEENGWCVYVSCMDCGCSTVELPYHTQEERIKAAQQAARTWNMGKVIACGPGE